MKALNLIDLASNGDLELVLWSEFKKVINYYVSSGLAYLF